jgi:DNA modification methylase
MNMSIRLLTGDCRQILPTWADRSVNCVVTSPPYWGLRDYGVDGQIGLEPTYGEYVDQMISVFREVRRVLCDDGTLWLNLGDSYYSRRTHANGGAPTNTVHRGGARDGIEQHFRSNRAIPQNGLKPKDLCGIPWRVAFALQADGWWLRQDIIWSKPNPMPESVTDRCTKAHEYIFLLSKCERYYFDQDAIAEKSVNPLKSAARYESAFSGRPEGAVICPGDSDGQRYALKGMREFDGYRNRCSVWTVTTQPFSEAHFATFPPALIEPCILAGCPQGGTVLDLFAGAGTTGLVADRLQRNAILIELNPAYAEMAERRIRNDAPLFAEVDAARQPGFRRQRVKKEVGDG